MGQDMIIPRCYSSLPNLTPLWVVMFSSVVQGGAVVVLWC